jgi:ribosomal protein L37AE/L43A
MKKIKLKDEIKLKEKDNLCKHRHLKNSGSNYWVCQRCFKGFESEDVYEIIKEK